MIEKLLNELDENIKNENHEKVIEIIDSIISLKPDLTTPLLLKKAEVLINLEEYEKAISTLEKYLTDCEDCDYFDAYVDLADCYSGLEDEENEEKYLLKAYEIDPKKDYITKKLTFHYYLTGKYQKCIDIIEKLISENKADLEDYCNLVYSYIQLENIEKAIECGEEIIKLDPHNVDMYVTLTISYEKIGDEDKLKDTCRRIIALEDDGSEQLTLLKAQSYIELGEEKKAFETVDRVIRTTPYNPFGYLMKGMIYQKINKQKEAEECFEEAYKLEPEIFALMLKNQMD